MKKEGEKFLSLLNLTTKERLNKADPFLHTLIESYKEFKQSISK